MSGVGAGWTKQPPNPCTFSAMVWCQRVATVQGSACRGVQVHGLRPEMSSASTTTASAPRPGPAPGAPRWERGQAPPQTPGWCLCVTLEDGGTSSRRGRAIPYRRIAIAQCPAVQPQETRRLHHIAAGLGEGLAYPCWLVQGGGLAWTAGVPARPPRGGRGRQSCSRVAARTTASGHTSVTRSIRWLSSRTLPGQS